jgi:hypothetical protein
MWWLRWMREGLLFLRIAKLISEDGVAGIVWLLVVLFVLSWWNGR